MLFNNLLIEFQLTLHAVWFTDLRPRLTTASISAPIPNSLATEATSHSNDTDDQVIKSVAYAF